MRVIKLGILVLSLGVLAAAADNKDKKDADGIKGTWALTAVTDNGQEGDENFIKSTKAKFEDKSYSQIFAGNTVEEGTYKLDLEKTPKTIDFIIEKGMDKGKTQLGVYEIDGDTLKFCVTKSGSELRPKNFDAKAGSNQTLFVWKRVKE
jgi:uncharacterized protein (TIGR03067 family)